MSNTFQEALSHPGWRSAMIEEMDALDGNGTWNLVHLPTGKKVIGCRWVFAVKVNSDSSVARLKARLMVKGTLRPMVRTILIPFPPLLR